MTFVICENCGHVANIIWPIPCYTCPKCGGKYVRVTEQFQKLEAARACLQEYINANQLIVNQFTFHDGKYWWKGEDLNELKERKTYFENTAKRRLELIEAGNYEITELRKSESKLREKAEKWDFVRPAMAKTLLELNDKLEAVKKHLKKFRSSHNDWQMGIITKWKKELDEILGAEK